MGDQRGKVENRSNICIATMVVVCFDAVIFAMNWTSTNGHEMVS